MPASGDKCPNQKCRGRLRVRTSRLIAGTSQERTLECKLCGADGGKQIVPADVIWRRETA